MNKRSYKFQKHIDMIQNMHMWIYIDRYDLINKYELNLASSIATAKYLPIHSHKLFS